MSKPDYRCVVHPDRKATHDPQALLVCDDCFATYQRERALGLPFVKREFLQRLIREAYKTGKEHDDGNQGTTIRNS